MPPDDGVECEWVLGQGLHYLADHVVTTAGQPTVGGCGGMSYTEGALSRHQRHRLHQRAPYA